MSTRSRVAASLLVLGVAAGCTASDEADPVVVEEAADRERTTSVDLELAPDEVHARLTFRDSSVPPEFHRSYTVSVAPGSATVEVSDYDDVLASSQIDLDEAIVEEFTDRLGGVPEEDRTSDCTGSPFITSIVSDGTDVISHRVVADRCEDDGKQHFDEIEEAWAPIFDELGVDDLVESTR